MTVLVYFISDYDEAWVGFYTSYGNLKGLARSCQATLHAGEGLFTLYNNQAGANATLNRTSVLHTLMGLRQASAEVYVSYVCVNFEGVLLYTPT